MLPITALRRRNWNDALARMQRELSRAFDEDVEESAGGYPVDIREDQKNFYVDAELPGFKKHEVEVTLNQGNLSIVAERQAEKKEPGRHHLHERRFTRVERSFTLPTATDDSKVDAELEGGVLHLVLPKTSEVLGQKIEVK